MQPRRGLPPNVMPMLPPGAQGYQGYQGYGTAPQPVQSVQEILSQPLGEPMPDLSGATSAASRQRQIADMLLQGAQRQDNTSIAGGLSQLGQAFLARRAGQKADTAEDKQREMANLLMQQAMQGGDQGQAALQQLLMQNPDATVQYVMNQRAAEAEAAKPQYKEIGDALIRISPDGVTPVYEAPQAPQERWEDIEAPPGMPGYYQRNTTTGQIERVAAPPSGGIRIGADGTVQIGGPAALDGIGYGSAPKGQDAAIAFDRQGNPIVTPGPQQEAYNKAIRGFEEFKAQNSIVVQDIDRALGAISGWSTGAGAALKDLPIVGGITPAGQLESLLSTIQANVGFDKLQAMREASPTGGALGSVTEKELAFLQSVFGSLRQDTRAENVRFNLDRLKTHMQGREARIQAALEADFPSLATTAQRRGAANAQIQALSADEAAELERLEALERAGGGQ